MDLITLSDLPELKGSAAKPRVTIPIGRIDSNLRDPRYGKFSITPQMAESWKRNLHGVLGGQVSLDFDHSSDRGQGTRAAAWVKDIELTGQKDGDLVLGHVQFTKAGAKAVRDGEYKYTSPTFVANYRDEHGKTHGEALIGGALTNRPVLRKGMPTLSLSRDDFEGVELARVSAKTRKKTATLKGKGKPEFPMPDKLHARLALQFVGRALKAGSITEADAAKIRARANRMLGKKNKSAQSGSSLARDSRGQMALTRSELAKALDLNEDADTDAILAATCVTLAQDDAEDTGTTAATAKPEKAKKAKKAEPTTLNIASATNGQITLSAEQYAELLTGANAGQAAAKQLANQTFNAAWEKALSEGRAAPSQEEQMRELHKLDPELAVKTLDSLVKIVPTKPTGSGEGVGHTGPAPLGMDDDRYQLHRQAQERAKTLAAEHNIDLDEAYSLAVIEIDERANENGGAF